MRLRAILAPLAAFGVLVLAPEADARPRDDGRPGGEVSSSPARSSAERRFTPEGRSAPGGNGKGYARPRPRPRPAPEFDPASAGLIATVLAGGAAILARRRRS